ncbi:MAG TPA: squalene synthase HpnC, partial [Phycisphaerales bacterium]|nr:squalene synthase HpnC [Phycisphaerales bacterium]
PESSSSGAPAMSAAEARAYVANLATGHYENFSVLSRLVPERLRDDFAAVYAYCRWSDDLGDETGNDAAAREKSLELLAWWRGQLEACFKFARAGAASTGETSAPPNHPVFIALAETIRRHGLSPEPFHHLIDAFEQDQRVTRYETWEQVIGYCTRSADPVGRIVLALFGVNGQKPGDADLIRMSDATCTALQLTNFWQDVRRDLIERDRVYLPSAETAISAGELHEWLSRGDDPDVRIRFIKALRPLVHRTRELFATGRPLPRALGREAGPIIWLFGAGGEHVLTAVEKCGCTTLWHRPRLTSAAKAGLVLSAMVKQKLWPAGGVRRA